MAVAARDEVRLLAADRALDQAGPVRVAQPQHLALDRAHRDAGGVGQVELRDVDARGDHDLVRRDGALGGDDAGHAVALDAQAGGARGVPDVGHLAPQRRDELARIDGVVGLDVQREPDRRRERGLELARLRRPQPLDRQPEAAAELGQAIQRLGLVAVAGDDERADGAVARVLELVAEGLVALRALQAELQQVALAELRLGDRREHPRGDVPRAGLAGVDHDHRAGAALLGAPRAGEADRTAADDGDVEAL